MTIAKSTPAHRRPAPGGVRSLAPFPAVLFFLALLGATGRGALELVLGKSAAYGVQLALIVLLIAVLLVRGRPRRNRYFARAVSCAWAFVLLALISAFVSYQVNGVDYAAAYVAVMVFFAALLALFSGWEFSFAHSHRAAPAVAIVAVLLMVVAWLQQFANWTFFPGSDLGTFGTTARPSSLTGSFLHYPIALAVLSFTLLGIYSVMKKRLYLAVGLLGLVSVVASFSRSGMVIVLAGLALSVVLARRFTTAFRIVGSIALAGIVLFATLPTGDYVARLMSIFDSSGAGNVSRMHAWESILDLWTGSPLIVGSYTGVYTNVTSNFASVDAAGVAESGLLQQLISFGLLGAAAYYALMLISVAASPASTPWYRAGLLAAIMQSFVYQSVEVFPFMVAVALTPFIAHQVGAAAAERDELALAQTTLDSDGPRRHGRGRGHATPHSVAGRNG